MTARDPWPWCDPQDRALCAAALDGLVRRGAFDHLPPAAAASAGRTVALATGAPDPAEPSALELPWASWALRLSGALGLAGERQGSLALAVALVCAPADDAPAGADAAARMALAAAALEPAGADAATLAWLLAAARLAPEGALSNPTDAEREAPPVRAGLREPAVALGLAARLAGADPAPFDRAAAALAPATSLVRAALRLWRDREDADLRAARWSPALRVVAADPELGPALLIAVAGDREHPARRHELRSLLARPAARARLGDVGRALLAEARAAAPPALVPLVDGLAATLAFLEQVAAFHDLVAGATASPSGPPGDGVDAVARAREDVRGALALLTEDDPSWRGSWEVRRWGLDGRPLQLVGRWFADGLVLQALADLGRPDPARVAALLAEVPPGELRYFGVWDGVPPDADDLGLFLQLAARLPEPRRDLVESWLAVLEASVAADGVAPTWFHRAPSGAPTVAEGVRFGGDDCTAVRLCLLRGLVAWAPQRFEPLVRVNLARVLESFDGAQLGGCYYYDPSWAALQLARLAQELPPAVAGERLGGDLRALGGALRRALGAAQRLDGGWGSPQRTAACAEALVALTEPAAGGPPADRAAPRRPEREDVVLRRAMRYLGETQRPDGSWRAEPLFVTPGKSGHVTWHEGRELTTALCARALHVCAAALETSRSAADGG